MNPFLLLLSIVNFMHPPGTGSHVVPESPERLAASRESHQFAKDTMKRWEADGDSVAAVGALRGAIETWPERTRRFAYDIGRILQSEGRLEEAANWYWFKVERRGDLLDLSGSQWGIVRIFDALEDAGRRNEAKQILDERRISRRDFYILAFRNNSEHPLWLRKIARKLLADDPKDADALRALKFSEDDLARRAAAPERFPATRDIPYEARRK